MKVTGFVGESGSGKSHLATKVARDNNIKLIIDDGLLISGNRVVAGISAKSEKTWLASIRRALFTMEEHKKEVINALKNFPDEELMIVGTSENMINKITEALMLPEVLKFIRIEDVSSAEDIKKAKAIRKKGGMHVVPVPTFEIKEQFSGYFLRPLQFLIGEKEGKNPQNMEKSIVRPTYSYLGDYSISKGVIKNLCVFETKKLPEVHKVRRITTVSLSGGIAVKIDVVLKMSCNVQEVCEKIHYNISKIIDRMTSINILSIDVNVKSVKK